MSFGTPYTPGEDAPHFWYDYFSPRLPTEVPTKKALRAQRAAMKATTTATVPSASTKTSEVPPALSAMFAGPAAPSPVPSPSPSPAFLAPPGRSYAATPTLCGSATTSATAVSHDDESDVYLPSPITSNISPTTEEDSIDYTPSDCDNTDSPFSSIDLSSEPSVPYIPSLPSSTSSPEPLPKPAPPSQNKDPGHVRRTLLALRGVKTVRRCDDRQRRVNLLA